ncbi:MAG TPA: NUDIX domain-containing protein [Candidatus Acidoferrum sp.]|nr:NUDIX domain-containing protein [Candidatus Acidoferrum sp.]
MQTARPSARFVRLSHLRKLLNCEQVAAVCYRVRSGSIEFLLVRTRGSRRWTFPKGSAEAGLTHAQAAALEAFEEAGVHGRIEEISFAQYVRRRSEAGKQTSIPAEKAVVVNTYLCEVLRLRPPQESNRDRTWFSIEDAKRSLREGRKPDEGNGLARVIDRAVACVQRRCESDIANDRWQDTRLQLDQPRLDIQQKDALQKVRFDFAEAYGDAAMSVSHIRRQIRGMRQSAEPVDDYRPRQALQCEVLEFSPTRWKKDRALGPGTKKG